MERSGPTIDTPTRIPLTTETVEVQWKYGGSSVALVGSFDKGQVKHLMVEDKNSPGVFKISLELLEGTHQFYFLVDGQVRFAPDIASKPTCGSPKGKVVNFLEIRRTRQSDDSCKDTNHELSNQCSEFVEGPYTDASNRSFGSLCGSYFNNINRGDVINL